MVFPTSHLFMKKISVRAHCTHHCPCTCHHHHHHLWAAQLCALYHEPIDSSCILKPHDHSCTLCFQYTSYRPSLNTWAGKHTNQAVARTSEDESSSLSSTTVGILSSEGNTFRRTQWLSQSLELKLVFQVLKYKYCESKYLFLWQITQHCAGGQRTSLKVSYF